VTNFRDKRTQWNGSQLSYFLHITQPSDTREDLYCLTLAQTEALIAVIEHWRYLTRWLDDDPDMAISQSAVFTFVNDTQRRLMMPCGSDNIIVLSQFTPDGDYQESTDGGATYHDAPNRDPRNAVPLPPPFLPPGTEEAECTYADAIVNQFINGWINGTGDGEDLATVIEGILAFLAGILGAVGAVVAVIVLAIAASVVDITVAAWKAAFTSDVWDRLRCNIHDNQQPDGSFTAADIDAIYARIGDEETGVVLISLQQIVAALGWQGMTIAARSGVGSPTADCACSDACGTNWEVMGASHGTIIDAGDDFITVEASNAGGNYYVLIHSVPDTDCCLIHSSELISGSAPTLTGWTDCGTTPTEGAPQHTGIFGYDNYCVNYFQQQGAAPFTVKISFLPCPP